MIKEIRTDNTYTCMDENGVLLTITSEANNVYYAINTTFYITAEVVPVDEYRTMARCIDNKMKGKDGRYRKTKRLLDSHLRWLVYMLEEQNFIRKPTVM